MKRVLRHLITLLGMLLFLVLLGLFLLAVVLFAKAP